MILTPVQTENLLDRVLKLAADWELLDDPNLEDDHPGSASGFAQELRTIVAAETGIDEIDGYLLSQREVKTQYGTAVIWKDPKAAGQRGDKPLEFWFDDRERADAFALANCKPIDIVDGELVYADPPEYKNEVRDVQRMVRRAIEVYSAPQEDKA